MTREGIDDRGPARDDRATTDPVTRGTRSTSSSRPTERGRSDADGPTRRSLLSATALGVVTAAAGCLTNPWGPDEDVEADRDDGGNSGTESEANDADEPEETPLDREPAQVVEVAPDGFRFEPGSFEIDAGETVHWQWEASGHNVRVRSKPDGSDWEGTPGTDADTFGEGYEHGYTFETPGEYVYFCAPHRHQGLEGTFTVR